MITIETVIHDIEAYCLKAGMAETTFGKKAVNDGKLLTRLRHGRSISLDTYNRIVAVLSDVQEAAE